jgi:hypothetical protein
MTDTTKGGILMAGFIGKALSGLLMENDAIINHAKTLAGVAACRMCRRETATNYDTGERVYRWQIEFKSQEDADLFNDSLRGIVKTVTGEER